MMLRVDGGLNEGLGPCQGPDSQQTGFRCTVNANCHSLSLFSFIHFSLWSTVGCVVQIVAILDKSSVIRVSELQSSVDHVVYSAYHIRQKVCQKL